MKNVKKDENMSVFLKKRLAKDGNKCYDINNLLEIMRFLRSENGCPWDKEQTHSSIKMNFIEEVYEAVDAIDKNDVDGLKEELGDVLLQIVFHSVIEEEKHRFSFQEVVNGICEKLIERHPHVFSDLVVSDTDTVLKNWDEIKNKTKGIETAKESILAVPDSFPALLKAQKIIKRAKKSGLVIDEKSNDNPLGEELFFICNKADENGIDAEEALLSYIGDVLNKM